MTPDQLAVSLVGVGVVILLAGFFFGPKQARRAVLRGGFQEIEVTVKGRGGTL